MNIGQAKAILPRKLRGANLDDIQGVTDFTLFKEAAGNLLLRIDPQETLRTRVLKLYPGIRDYPAASDLKQRKVVSLVPQGRRTRNPGFSQGYARDINPEDRTRFGITYANGQKFERIEHGLGEAGHVTDLTVANWAASGTASSVAADSRVLGDGGLAFDVSVGTGILTYTAPAALDLSSEELLASFFLELYLPDASNFTSVTLRVGDSAAAYWEMTGTPFLGSSFVDGVNLVQFDWDGVTPTGSPDASAIDYVRLAVAMATSDTDLVAGPLLVALPTPYEESYYSNRLFRSSAGAFIETPTADDDDILLEGNEENAFVYECAKLISEDMQREDRSSKFDAKLNGDGNEPGLYKDIQTDAPSEATRPTSTYWKPRRFHRGREGRTFDTP